MNLYSKKERNGFTLTELVVVVAIIAVIATLVVSRVAKLSDRAKIVAAENDLHAIAAAITDPESGYIRDLVGIPGFSPAYMRLANLLISTNVYGSASKVKNPGGVRLDEFPDARAEAGCAKGCEFTQWNEESGRGWRGPYLRHATGVFPARDDVRFRDDAAFSARGFYPETSGLRLPVEIRSGEGGCSVYGFPGEPAVIDPWGNPYVIQIPPPQAFSDFKGSNTNLPDDVRFRYARVVSAGPDGRLDTPCFGVNATNDLWVTTWTPRSRRLARQAGLIDGVDRGARGDDLVLFLMRNDIDEGEEPLK